MRKELFNILKVYFFTVVVMLALVLAFTSVQTFVRDFADLMTSTKGLLFFHFVFLFFYVVFLVLRYFKRVYRNKGLGVMAKRLTLRLILPILVFTLAIKAIIHINTNELITYAWDHSIENFTGQSNDRYAQDGKHRGMTVHTLARSNAQVVADLVKSNIEWVSIFPYLSQKKISSTKILGGPKQLGVWSKRDSALIESIDIVHQHCLHVMLKPHIWMSDGWRSNISFDSQKDWTTWFENYRNIILHYAMIAEASNTELLCIGTELRSSLKDQPQQWIALICEIKTIYSGKLTYASNWDSEIDQIEFWNELDYIGIQAYYPLTKNKKPNLETIRKGWQPYVAKLESISKLHDKPILFTEIGYRNDHYATIEPWKWGSLLNVLYKKKSDETQRLAYEALFLELWDQSWFAGLYAWEWRSGDFPIHSKPSENTIAKWYSNE